MGGLPKDVADVTRYDYDAHGRAGRIVDANGLVTDLTYTPRGQLARKVTGTEATSFEYDNNGQLRKATLPDGSSLTYTYDDAHRLTGIADNAGNAITYTLDLVGNRIGEDMKDPDGNLKRRITRLYDTLDRVKQVTGAMQ